MPMISLRLFQHDSSENLELFSPRLLMPRHFLALVVLPHFLRSLWLLARLLILGLRYSKTCRRLPGASDS